MSPPLARAFPKMLDEAQKRADVIEIFNRLIRQISHTMSQSIVVKEG